MTRVRSEQFDSIAVALSGRTIMSNETVTIGGLQQLASSRGYAIALTANGCMLVNLRTHLPETNDTRESLVFSVDEAVVFLQALSPSGPNRR